MCDFVLSNFHANSLTHAGHSRFNGVRGRVYILTFVLSLSNMVENEPARL